MRNKKNFTGILLILLGVILMVNKLGYFENFKIIGGLISLALLFYAFTSLRKLNFSGVLFPLAFIAMIFQEELGIENLVPWTLLISASLASLGLNMIFSRKKFERTRDKYAGRIYINGEEKSFVKNVGRNKENELYMEGVFTSINRYLKSDEFTGGKVEAVFSGVQISFDKTDLKDGLAILDLELVFSGMDIVVPRDWEIVDNTSNILSGLHFKDYPNEGEARNKLVLTGEVVFSGVNIKYI